ncbi:hypothetical protein RRG08_061141 [Elysia crispata]|uniref:Uncharacterized protein n=1 Tax=Elysia crispata TaxID=231223 RepID=A0AAE0XE48_9GAST|nr:hypothetical protein RRG08_061141 [Elysia crispata]
MHDPPLTPASSFYYLLESLRGRENNKNSRSFCFQKLIDTRSGRSDKGECRLGGSIKLVRADLHRGGSWLVWLGGKEGKGKQKEMRVGWEGASRVCCGMVLKPSRRLCCGAIASKSSVLWCGAKTIKETVLWCYSQQVVCGVVCFGAIPCKASCCGVVWCFRQQGKCGVVWFVVVL